MKILVSACLLGHSCRYDGGHCFRKPIAELVKGHEVILVCPEQEAGLPTPRLPCEMRDGKLITKDGVDITDQMEQGIQNILSRVSLDDVDCAILKSKSPSCGHGFIYDGTFQNRLVSGTGFLAKALLRQGVLILQVD